MNRIEIRLPEIGAETDHWKVQRSSESGDETSASQNCDRHLRRATRIP
jgi:hypothetical protein